MISVGADVTLLMKAVVTREKNFSFQLSFVHETGL